MGKEKIKHVKRLGVILFSLIGIIAFMMITSGGVFGITSGVGMMVLPLLSIKDGKILGKLNPDELKALTDEEVVKYQKNLHEMELKMLSTEFEGTKLEVQNLKGLLEKTDKKDEIELLGKQIAELYKYQRTALKQVEKGEKKDIATALKLHEKSFMDFKKRQLNTFEFKATYVPASDENNPTYQLIPRLGVEGNKMPFAYEVFSRTPLKPGVNGKVFFRDWKVADFVRATDDIPVTGPVPESTYKTIWDDLEVRIIADSIKMNEFASFDIQTQNSLQAELERFLNTNMMRKENQNFWNGNNATDVNQFSGVYTLAPLYNYGAETVTYPQADITTLVDHLKTKIEADQADKYNVDCLLINPYTATQVKQARDANGQRLYQGMTLEEIFSLPKVKATAYVPVGEMVICDSMFAEIIDDGEYKFVVERTGTDLEDFAFTIRVHKRAALLIRGIDLSGFYKVDDIDAAVLAITTP